MKKILLFYIFPLIIILSGSYLAIQSIYNYQNRAQERKAAVEAEAKLKAQNKEVEDLLAVRRAEAEKDSVADAFGDDGVVKILLIGLDSRAGETSGHCDAIQFITIDKNKETVNITAVPRGTYSPLPKGMGVSSSDYYVSNACGLAGLDYGIKQIEKILGQEEDYLIVVGFSEVLGILRNLKLPTMDTLRWLRLRQGYAIGEPQRAHNHSTFLKELILRFVPQQNSFLNKIFQYIIYKLVKTDLSFAQTQNILAVLSEMDLNENPDRIMLGMRPVYNVADIQYSPENVSEYLDKMISPIKNTLNEKDYSGLNEPAVEENLLKIIGKNIDDPEFLIWGFENSIWSQINDVSRRLAVQYDFLSRYLAQTATLSELERKNIVADYILEMEYYGEETWARKGRDLLFSFFSQPLF